MIAEEHSPLPWEHVAATDHHGAYIVAASGLDVCDLYAMTNPSSPAVCNGGNSRPVPFTDMDANAALIVRAVNNHERLVEILKIFLGQDERFQIAIGGNPLAVDKMLASARLTLDDVSSTPVPSDQCGGGA